MTGLGVLADIEQGLLRDTEERQVGFAGELLIDLLSPYRHVERLLRTQLSHVLTQRRDKAEVVEHSGTQLVREPARQRGQRIELGRELLEALFAFRHALDDEFVATAKALEQLEQLGSEPGVPLVDHALALLFLRADQGVQQSVPLSLGVSRLGKHP